jgi:thiol-disulfide isomerase/thioredoxin
MQAWTRTLALACSLVVGIASTATAADPEWEGTWKLVLLPFGEFETLLLDAKQADGKVTADVRESQKDLLEAAKVVAVDRKEGSLSMTVRSSAGEGKFVGTLARGEANPTYLGTFLQGGSHLPARLEKSTKRGLGPLVEGKLYKDTMAARKEADPKARRQALTDLIAHHRDDPSSTLAHADLLAGATALKLSEDEVRAMLDRWVESAKPYGPEWIGEIRNVALSSLAGQGKYASLTLAVARDAEAAMPAGSPVERRADMLQLMADTAKLAGDPEAEAALRARREALEPELDASYRKLIPPFDPVPFPGRRAKEADRVALVELFTGTECPPCLAADAAFDAMVEAYKPADVITLQYHLHIPGPDPLTNADAEARSEFYEVRGTPTLVFGGEPGEAGGGSLAASAQVYEASSALIDRILETKAKAVIDLKAERAGDVVTIRASAKVVGEPRRNAKLKLRLALVEDEVKYIGGNSVRFHHHVVRAMPGGPAGQAMVEGKGEAEATVDLGQLRQGLEKQLAARVKEGSPFPRALPPISLEHLSVVAFVQDDNGREVYQATLVTPAPAK